MAAESIIKKILDDATADAAAAKTQAEQQAAEHSKAAKSGAQTKAAAVLEKARADAAEAERRLLLTASLDARKNTLAKKRELLNAAFELAREELLRLEGAPFCALIVKLAVSASETGRETLRAPAGHRDRYAKPYADKASLLDQINAALRAAKKPGELTLGEPLGEIDWGFVLEGERSDIDCSLDSLLAAVRAGREQQVAALLFGEGEG